MAIAVVRRALELGVNYIDTAPRYTAGAWESETNIGKALRGVAYPRAADADLGLLSSRPCRVTQLVIRSRHMCCEHPVHLFWQSRRHI